ncbi:unnamed protein product [Withania somnifera]
MASIFKIIGFHKRMPCLDGDDDGDDHYDYAPAKFLEGDGDDNNEDYDYSPGASLNSDDDDDDDDADYDYAPAA